MKRVVITGLGTINPVGKSTEQTWEAIQSGKNGIDKITLFDTSDFPVKIAGEVKDFDPSEYMPKREAKKMDRFTQFLIASTQEAIKDSKIDISKEDAYRVSIIMGVGLGGLKTIQDNAEKLFEKGPSRLSPFFIPMCIANIGPGQISIEHGIKGASTVITTACAAGTNAIGEAYRNIKSGYSDIVITGGGEAAICKLGLGGFSVMKALNETEDINRASIPFDKERAGFVMGEGSATLILEELEHAKARGAKIYAEIVGYGTTSDAYHITSPDPEGKGGAKAMSLAVEDANIKPEDIDYINAHGTSTPYNDMFETYAIKKVFDKHAYDLSISSTKSMTGHLLGGAGAIEALISTLALRDGIIPPTINHKVKDEELDLDYTTGGAVKKDIKYALSNSLGFGGHNATVIIKKWEE